MYCNSETSDATSHGQGILINWALSLILKEVDKEADRLTKPNSSFHCPHDWTWDSLQELSLRSQHDVATQEGPIIWSVLMTIAVNKDQRKQTLGEEEGDKRDPWQVCQWLMVIYIACSYNSSREQLLSCRSYSTFETVKPHSFHVLSA